MVHVIAHRGWWNTVEEQNTLKAFERAFDAGIGVELDVRDGLSMHGMHLVVSHDPPQDENFLLFTKVLELLGDRPNILAVNVKSCGLAPYFAKIKAPKNWFFFDVGTWEEELDYTKHDLPIFSRSEGTKYKIVLGSEILHPTEPKQYHSIYRDLIKERLLQTGPTYYITDEPQEAMEFFK